MNNNIVPTDGLMSKSELLQAALWAVVALVPLPIFFLFLLAKGASCEAMASCVMVTCMFGVCSILLPIIYLAVAVFMMAMRCMSAFALVPFVVYCAIYVPVMTYVPPWQKVVPNVEKAYAEFKTKHTEPGRKCLYARAEWWGNLSKPLFDRLAGREPSVTAQP